MDVKRAADLYAQDRTLRQIGAELGVTADTIRWHLRQAGVAMRPHGRPKATNARARPLIGVTSSLPPWLSRRPSASAATVISLLRRTPTRAEITAARRAAHRLAASGQATIHRVKPPRSDGGGGSAYLILARPGTDAG